MLFLLLFIFGLKVLYIFIYNSVYNMQIKVIESEEFTQKLAV